MCVRRALRAVTTVVTLNICTRTRSSAGDSGSDTREVAVVSDGEIETWAHSRRASEYVVVVARNE